MQIFFKSSYFKKYCLKLLYFLLNTLYVLHLSFRSHVCLHELNLFSSKSCWLWSLNYFCYTLFGMLGVEFFVKLMTIKLLDQLIGVEAGNIPWFFFFNVMNNEFAFTIYLTLLYFRILFLKSVITIERFLFCLFVCFF